ncbi:MAG: 2-C-methyl-D-erythritol 2,4-cyclodiphosphate synthase [Deltaproteobacteria bacterium]|nr:2-C-methyl-D-erythritol 2,4-cyclodiphosphate synthase [Deltaproteobacteria bacterium]
MRIGHGYDLHTLTKDRALILGGVEIEYEKGLDGHSDADVLLHAIMDSLLGAAALGDIGKHFPPTDDTYKNISSLKLLKTTAQEITKARFDIVNIDATIICQEPRLATHIPVMIKNIKDVLGCEAVNIKATTEEGTGPSGRGEAISAHAVALLEGKI